MRDYATVVPQFWTGETGRALKEAGPEAVIVALYLMTCPHSNMIGLYYLPTLYLAHETGLGMEGALKGLVRASEAGFCTYDKASEHVFVHSMARFQVADSLKPGDNRVKGVINALSKVPKGPLVKAFINAYSNAFNLEIDAPAEAPCKPLASQEQEQEQEQEQDKKPARKRAASKHPIPENFALSDRVREWAREKQFDRLEKHLEHFRLTATAKGYTYADWDAALMNAIAGNWAKLPAATAVSQPGGGRRPL